MGGSPELGSTIGDSSLGATCGAATFGGCVGAGTAWLSSEGEDIGVVVDAARVGGCKVVAQVVDHTGAGEGGSPCDLGMEVPSCGACGLEKRRH